MINLGSRLFHLSARDLKETGNHVDRKCRNNVNMLKVSLGGEMSLLTITRKGCLCLVLVQTMVQEKLNCFVNLPNAPKQKLQA